METILKFFQEPEAADSSPPNLPSPGCVRVTLYSDDDDDDSPKI